MKKGEHLQLVFHPFTYPLYIVLQNKILYFAVALLSISILCLKCLIKRLNKIITKSLNINIFYTKSIQVFVTVKSDGRNEEKPPFLKVYYSLNIINKILRYDPS